MAQTLRKAGFLSGIIAGAAFVAVSGAGGHKILKEEAQPQAVVIAPFNAAARQACVDKETSALNQRFLAGITDGKAVTVTFDPASKQLAGCTETTALKLAKADISQKETGVAYLAALGLVYMGMCGFGLWDDRRKSKLTGEYPPLVGPIPPPPLPGV